MQGSDLSLISGEHGWGGERAIAATMVRAEQQAFAFVREYERSREIERQPEQRQEPDCPREYEHDRGGYSR